MMWQVKTVSDDVVIFETESYNDAVKYLLELKYISEEDLYLDYRVVLF